MKTFRVTRKFLNGILAGLTHTEETTVEFKVGFRCMRPIGGSAYEIISVEEIVRG